jgi:UDP-N-acetylmuramyl pentapeptide phosphotransferase/UDP-N-acetylglucosamine-1-phosphate transferase
MEFLIQKNFLINDINYAALLSLLGSFILVLILIPKISWIVESRNLIESPNKRSSHVNLIPTMAGVSFFLALLVMMIIFKNWDTNSIITNLSAAITLMFAIGLKDDLVISTPKAKVFGEILAISLVMFCNGFEVESLNGFLGIQNIPAVISYIIIIITILVIMNSYNLIDGIDGLAASIGVIVFSIYGFLFYLLELHFYFLLSLSLIGMLIGYLRFNLSKSKKVFMGDTGSLIIGFCIGFLCLKFMSLDASLLKEKGLNPENSVIIIMAIFFIPVFDTFRIIGFRLLNKKNIFLPDNNHIHHILINSGLTHFKSSLFLSLLNLFLAVGLIWLSRFFNSYWMVFFISLCFLLLLRIFYLLKKNTEKNNSSRHLISLIHFLF